MAADLVAQVKAEYPDDNIVLCGHSLAGGSVSYAGAVNDVNSFAIDPAPSKEGIINSEYDKIITAIPGGKSDGILNEPVTDSDGYYKSNTDIDIADIGAPIIGGGVGVIVGGPVGAVEGIVGGHIISEWGQVNDNSSDNESVYENSINEKNDIDDPTNPEFQDGYDGYGGDHLLGSLEDRGLEYGYIPYS